MKTAGNTVNEIVPDPRRVSDGNLEVGGSGFHV